MKRTVIIAILFASSAPTSARADVANEVSVGSFTRALRSESANALTGDSLGGAALGYARRLPIAVYPRLELWGTATLDWGTAEGRLFSMLDTEIDTFQVAVGVRARYRLWRFVVANARLDAGPQRCAVALRDRDNHSASDSGWGATSTAALGLELQAARFSRFGFGFRAELGYVAMTGVELTAKSEGAPADTLELERMEASLGHLDLGGRFFSFTLIGQF